MTDLSGPGARVLLIGTATYSQPSLPALPSVLRSVDTLSVLLRERCGVAQAQLRVLTDPPDARAMAEAITEEAAAAQSVLVIYYLGHGLVGPGDELFLSASKTGELTPGLAAHQALPFSAITEAVSACRASSAVVILDCCFSGRASFGLGRSEPAFSLPATHGIYLLASAERLALAPEDEQFTMFSGALITLLTQGDPRGPRMLTLDDAYDFVFRAVREADGPLPRRQAGDRSGELILAPNPAQPPPLLPEQDEDDSTASDRCPYLGLSAFGVDDAEVFHGREKTTAALVAAAAAAMESSSPLVVVGPSGSGKSSLLHAGLLARLRLDPVELPGAATWPWINLTPGDHPLQVLTARLTPGRSVTADDLRQNPARAADLAAALLRRASGPGREAAPPRLVLVVDQLEQLFTASVSPAERAAFLAAVRAIARPPAGSACRALVVLALRADFYGQAAEHQELRDALNTSQFIVGPMSQAEMRDAIEEPATAAGLRLDEGLADLILQELGAADDGVPGPDPGALPLLSHTLWAIWQRRSGARLTMAGYRAAGRVTGAIARSAEETYDALCAAEQDAVRRMLPRLVRVGGEVPDTIRELPRSSLLRGLPDQQAADDALNRLAATRLLTLDRDSVRLSHEALLRSWPRLREWVEADRDWLTAAQRLADDAKAWRESGEDRSRLYRGGTLAGVQEKAAQAGRSAELPPDSAGFLAASQRQERRAGTIRKAVIAGLATLLVLALGGGGTTFAFQQQAEAQRDSALAQLIASEASKLNGQDPNLATQLSIIAERVDPQSEIGAMIASQGNAGSFDDGTPVADMAPTADGRVLAVSTGTAIQLLDLRTGTVQSTLGQAAGFATGPIAVGSDVPLLVAATGPIAKLYPVESYVGNTPQDLPDLQMWNIADPARPRLLATVPGRGDISTVALSPTGDLIATGSPDGTIQLWNAANPRKPTLTASLRGDGKAVYSLAFGGDGTLASAGADKETRLWDVSRPANPTQLAQIASATESLDSTVSTTAHRVAFSPDGRYLAVAQQTQTYGQYPEVWLVTDPKAPRKLSVPTSTYTSSSDCDNLMGLAFGRQQKEASGQTQQALFVSCDTELDYWSMNAGNQPSTLQQQTSFPAPSGSGGGQVFFDTERKAVMDVTDDGVQMWQLRSQESGSLVTLFANSGFVAGSISLNSSGPPLMADTAYLPDLRLWNLSDSAAPKNLLNTLTLIPKGTGGEANAVSEGVALSGDGHILAASEVVNGQVVVALRRTARPAAAPAAMIRGLSDGAISLALSRDGSLLAVSDNSNYEPAETRPPTVKLYSVRNLTQPRLLASLPGNTFRVLVSPDGRMLVGLTANTILSWDIANPNRPVELPPQHLSQASESSDGAFSPDGSMLAVEDGEGVLSLWHLTQDRFTSAPVILSRQQSPGASAVAFSPDGRTLASTSQDPNTQNPLVDLWDFSDPAAPRLEGQWSQIDAGFAGVAALGYSANGQVLVVATGNFLNLWSTDPARIAASLCSAVGDVITPEQWRQYVPGLQYRPPCSDGAPAGT